jgi:FkbM family methyltransferase
VGLIGAFGEMSRSRFEIDTALKLAGEIDCGQHRGERLRAPAKLMGMRISQRIKQIVERASGLRIYRKLPHGCDVLYDLKKVVSQFQPTAFMDVSANVGDVAMQLARSWPKALGFCIEPVQSTCRDLEIRCRAHKNLKCFNVALSDSDGEAVMAIDPRFSVTDEITSGPGDGRATTVVKTQTLRTFCTEAGIHRVKVLKVDTEGHDLAVLKGGSELFADELIDIVQVESSLNVTNNRHVDVLDFAVFLRSYGYHLFGVYEQIDDWPNRLCGLRRADLVWMSNALARGLWIPRNACVPTC